MNKISAIILTKNAEAQIADCIDSVSFCDEVIIIDDGSTDRTADLGKHLGAKVFDFTADDFSAKRNFGLNKAKTKWVLYIDADERVTEELKKNIKAILVNDYKAFGAYTVNRKNFYFGKHEWPKTERMERLFNKNSLENWVGKVHETAVVKGKIGELEGILEHYTHQDLTSMLDKTIHWSKIEAELRMQSNHPQMLEWRFFRVMATAFYDYFFRQKGYKAGTAGVIESIYQSFSMFITYAKLWELQTEQKAKLFGAAQDKNAKNKITN